MGDRYGAFGGDEAGAGICPEEKYPGHDEKSLMPMVIKAPENLAM